MASTLTPKDFFELRGLRAAKYSWAEWNDALGDSIGSPKLKYYSPSWYNRSEKQYFAVFDDAHPKPNNRPIPIALTELQHYSDTDRWGMPYISVADSHQGQHIARYLFRMACEWLVEHHPHTTLARSSTSESGSYFQHVGDTECFRVALPWTQGYRRRSFQATFDNTVEVRDFQSTTARLVDALQQRNRQAVETLWPLASPNACNEAEVYPLQAALQWMPDMVPWMLERADPGVHNGIIGLALLDFPTMFQRWLDTYPPDHQGEAMVMMSSAHHRVLSNHPAWSHLSTVAQQRGAQLILDSGAWTMRQQIDSPIPAGRPMWSDTQWSDWRKAHLRSPLAKCTDLSYTA